MSEIEKNVQLRFRVNHADRVIGRTRRLGALLRKRFGRRVWYVDREDWMPLGAMAELALDDRREVSVTFRIAGQHAGSVSAREGQWFRAHLSLRLSTAEAESYLREAIEVLEPDEAACGEEVSGLVSVLTYRLERPKPDVPEGVVVERFGPGWVIRCGGPAVVPIVAAWLTASVEPATPVAHPQLSRPAPVLVPSYLHLPSSNTASGDGTVIGGAPAGAALPFRQGSPVMPPPSAPIEQAADAGGTLMAPLPDEARRVPTGAAHTFDPDFTLPPAAAKGPVVPFTGRTTPERARELAGPPSGPADDAGGTIGIAIPPEVRARLAEALEGKEMPLEAYAAMRAHCTLHGEDAPDVMERFGLTRTSKQQVQQKYFERFRADPALRERFEVLLREEIRKHHRMKGEGT